MNETVKNYVLLLIIASAAIMLAEFFLPKGKIKPFAVFAVSVVMSVAVIKPMFSFFNEIDIPSVFTKTEIDLLPAVENTVHSFEHFENATVSVLQKDGKCESITVTVNNEKLLDKAEFALKREFVKKMLSVMYNTENVTVA